MYANMAGKVCSELLDKITQIVKNAGRIILSARDTAEAAEVKTSHRDLVTKYDRAVEDFLKQELLGLLPGAAFLGEEGDETPQWESAEWLFIVDPIDGTTNFVQGFPNSCISVGLMHCGVMEYGVIYNPYTDEVYRAKRGEGAWLGDRRLSVEDADLEHSLMIFGSALYYRDLVPVTTEIFNEAFPKVQDIRRFGAAALDFCYIAAGKAGVFFEARLCPWDYAAGSLIAQEAGAVVSALSGAPLDYYHKCSVLVGTPTAHREFLALAKQSMTSRGLR